jgi:hypothetical protein
MVPPLRAILLGASNLTFGFADALGVARSLLGSPLEVLAALGHGRSYGVESRVLARSLSGIVECGLWSELERRGPAPSCALLTDVGNDLGYGFPAAAIAAWVEWCLDRLRASGARVVITCLPEASLRRVGPARFYVARSLLFPRSRLTRGAVLAGAAELNDRLRGLAAARGAVLVEPRAEWYGLDAIHIRRRRRGEAWREFLASWGTAAAADGGPVHSVTARVPRRGLRPERWRFAGMERRRDQPCARLADGTEISLY